MSTFAKTTWYHKDGFALLDGMQDILIADMRAQNEGWSNKETVFFVMCVDSDPVELAKMRHAVQEGKVLPSLFSTGSSVDWVEVQNYYRKRFNKVQVWTEDALNRIHANNMEMTITSLFVWTRGYCSDDDVRNYMHEQYGWPLDLPTQEQPYELKRDGKLLFTGTENECYFKLQRIQGQSADWAVKYEGYTITPFKPGEKQQ